MASEASNKKIAAVIPAFNEAGRIEKVLDVVASHPAFSEVIVVDDASSDRTALIAKRYPVRVIQNKINLGKGRSIDKAIKSTDAEIIFFCDADVRGLSARIIDEITAPVVNEEVDMFIGMRNRKIYFLRFIVPFVPLLGGERALKKTLWNKLPEYYKERFRIETALNFYAELGGRGYKFKVFKGLTQTIKEKKYGLYEGFKQRVGMYRDILSAEWMLRRQNAEENMMPSEERQIELGQD